MKPELKENENFEGVFLLKDISESRTRAGKPYLALVLGNSESDLCGENVGYGDEVLAFSGPG